jgi:3-hydroxybutyryl-CoA dehydrogenase
MHLLIIDGAHMKAELEAKFGPDHQYTYFEIAGATNEEWQKLKREIKGPLRNSDVVFDFGHYKYWSTFDLVGKTVFLESSSTSLSQTIWSVNDEQFTTTLFGFCGLSTLLNRPLLEVSLYNSENAPQLVEICAALGTDYRVVQDRVGLVTPRVICMLINEACYTLQEGTASIRDIDKSMKLGTSYPRGPFEWANLIGVSRVYAVLEAMWQDTHEERYKVCPLLKTMYLRGESFPL